MPEVSVLIDLPEGWELAEPKPRVPKDGEWCLSLHWSQPLISEGIRHKVFIVRPKQPEYVNVRLRREDAEMFTDTRWYPSSVAAAFREALGNTNDLCGKEVLPNISTCIYPRGHGGAVHRDGQDGASYG